MKPHVFVAIVLVAFALAHYSVSAQEKVMVLPLI